MSTQTKQQEAYQKEAENRWGHTEAYKQSVERASKWTDEDKQRIETEGTAIRTATAELMGKPIADTAVQVQMERYYQYMQTFYNCSYEMFAGLGDLYTQDPRFTAYYDDIKPGLAKFMCDAMHYYADKHK